MQQYKINVFVGTTTVPLEFINIGMKGAIKMPVFYILVFIAAILLWFLLAFMFKPMGKLGHRIWQDAVDAINEEENETKKE